MQRGIRKNTNRILLPNMMISQSLIQSVMKGIIIILCLYIAIKCVNLITGDRAKEASSQVISDTSKMLAKEIVENGSVMSRYMLYIENHGSMTEAAKKEVLDQIVSDYINHESRFGWVKLSSYFLILFSSSAITRCFLRIVD